MKTKLSPSDARAKDACPSCGVSWVLHSGIINQCARYEVALQALNNIAELPKAGRAGRVAVATLRLLQHCK